MNGFVLVASLTSMANLAFTWKEQGRDSKALGLMKERVRLRERVVGTSHPDFTSSSNALARWAAEQVDASASVRKYAFLGAAVVYGVINAVRKNT